MEADGWYLSTCGSNDCNSSSYLSVSVIETAVDSSYWKIVSPTGKTGEVKLNDEIKIVNTWGETSCLNTCWHSSDCGEGNTYGINTAHIDSADSKPRASNSDWELTTDFGKTLDIEFEFPNLQP